MADVIDLFTHAKTPGGGQMPPDSIDIGQLAWMPMHVIRAKALEADSPSGLVLIAHACRIVARELVFSRYAEPGESGVFKALATDTALRRVVDLLDLAQDLDEAARGTGGTHA